MFSLKNGPFGQYGTVSLDIKGAIARAAISNPPINILDNKLLSDLHALLTILSTTSHSIKVIIFSSTNPKFFVAHYDLHIISAESPLPSPLKSDQVSGLYVEVVRMLWKMPVISIGEINGQAFGAGNELLVQMDMRFAGPNTKLGSLEVGLGVFAGNGELQFMTKLIGRARTLEYFLSSGTVDAEEADRIGWVNKAFSSVEAMQEHVNKLAERIATFPTGALAATKGGVNEQAPSEEALNNDLGRFQGLAADQGTQRAVTGFLKRSDDQKEGEWELGLNHNLVELWPGGPA
jgi:enoyl-CoA hydratase/carnithine racemase